MREVGQSAGDTLLATRRTTRSHQQRTANRQLLHKTFRAAPSALMAKSSRVTSRMGANRVAATCICSFAPAEVAESNTNSTRSPAAVSPGPRMSADQRGCRLLRRLAAGRMAGGSRRSDNRLRGVHLGALPAKVPDHHGMVTGEREARAPSCSFSCSSPGSAAVRRSPHKRVTCASGRLRTASESGQRTLNRGRAVAGQRGAVTIAGLGRHCVTGIVQVTAILDLPRAPGPADQVHTGSIARICKVSQRSAGTGPTWSRSVMAIAATPLVHVTCDPGRVTVIHRRAGWRGSKGTSCQCPPIRTGATPAGNTLVAPGTGYARACKPVTEPDDRRGRESKRCGEPLARARIRPPYVRNHCYTAAHSGTS
jgi:hypothetical protein